MEDQDELILILIIRKSECEELGLEANTKAVLEDVKHNADFYIANLSVFNITSFIRAFE